MRTTRLLCPFAVSFSILIAGSVHATAFTTGYTDGTHWNTVFAQGFTPSISPTPDPGLVAGSSVFLNSFSFFKSGNADTASNVKLVIISPFFSNLTGLTTSSPAVVGVSSNTIAGTSAISTGSPETFTFNSLQLAFGGSYGAVAANIDGSGNITPVLISALDATYVETSPGSGIFHPQTNYGTESQFQYATSNFISGGFFNTFSGAGDADFVASLDTVPEPASVCCLLASAGILMVVRRRR